VELDLDLDLGHKGPSVTGTRHEPTFPRPATISISMRLTAPVRHQLPPLPHVFIAQVNENCREGSSTL